MKIAVIGGRGFIGKEFVEFASIKGHETVVIGSEANVFSEEGKKQVEENINSCDSIVFFAARRPIKEFTIADYQYNVSLAEKYMKIASSLNISNMVITSSRSVYSDNNIPWKETDFQAPLSLYGSSKQAIDSLALLYNKLYGLKIKCLRLAQVIGMGEKDGFLLKTVVTNAIAGKTQTVYGKGIGERQYIYVKDVCDVVLRCIESCKDQSGIYNIGMKDSISISNLVKTINEVYGNTSGIVFLEDKPEDSKKYLMDVSKAENELGWKAGFDIHSAFTDMKDNK